MLVINIVVTKKMLRHFKICLNFILVENRAGSFYNNGSHLLITVVFLNNSIFWYIYRIFFSLI